ncbi:N-acetylglucosamine-6-phosphate deacetylase [Proteiniclasticum sp. SCR006]|uniref:N-acetylglucosamine-6-phosphate deacetylase n=1 Tax=Proteiniclasticum aestuarii TaxID=2817862 RepID=A0A939KIE3_9CLOT|nr:N-acetylglucosamine-6-phosphate deacetylase [Proteiniclasticum aestuarii]MBO1264058.1 N-acetylglucosamine-6-phosphate deacetylase [Proteiniclasticum aestuarii]
MILHSNKIHTPEGTVSGYLTMKDGRILSISEVKPEGEVKEYGDLHVIPGFIDLHVHGFSTGSFWYEKTEDSLNRMAESMIQAGVTTFLGTTGTDAVEVIIESLVEAQSAIKNWTPSRGSRILGVHLEGPFINKEFKGMQREEYCMDPDVMVTKELLHAAGEGNVYLMTLAPELPGAEEVIKHLHEQGIQVSVGHSAADLKDIARLKGFGLGGVTHMYSGMRGFHHRRPGVVGAALYFDDLYCEFAKQTGMTVSHEAFSIAYKVKGKEKIMLCTDCTGLAHVERPFHHYIRKETYIPDGDHVIVKSDGGTEKRINRKNFEEVDGLELSYVESVRNIQREHGFTFEEIITMASVNPAKYIGIYDKVGSLEEGKYGDLLIVEDDFKIQDIYVQGVQHRIK